MLWLVPVKLAECHQCNDRFRENTAGRKINLIHPKDTYVIPSKCLPILVFKKNAGATTTSLIQLFQDFTTHMAKKFSKLSKSPLMKFKTRIYPTLQRLCLFKAAWYVFED